MTAPFYAIQYLILVQNSLVAGSFVIENIRVELSSACKVAVIAFETSQVKDLTVDISDSTALASSLGDTSGAFHNNTTGMARGCIFLFFYESKVNDSRILMVRVNATLSAAFGVQNATLISEDVWVDVVLVFLYSCKNCSVVLQDVAFRGRAVGGNLVALATWPQLVLHMVALGVSSRSEEFVHVSFSVERVSFDAFVHVKSSTPTATTFLSRIVLQFVFLVSIAASCSDLVVSVRNSHVSRWSVFPDVRMILDARALSIVSMAAVSSDAGPLSQTAPLLSARVTLTVANVAIVCLESEWHDSSFLIISGTQQSNSLVFENCSAYQLSSEESQRFLSSGKLVWPPAASLLRSSLASPSLVWAAMVWSNHAIANGGTQIRFRNGRATNQLAAAAYLRPLYKSNQLFPGASLSVVTGSLSWESWLLIGRQAVSTQWLVVPGGGVSDLPAVDGLVTAQSSRLQLALTHVTFYGFAQASYVENASQQPATPCAQCTLSRVLRR